MRTFQRSFDALRPIHFEMSYNKYAEGSCLVQFGDTHVVCSATVEEKVPPFLRHTGTGWFTAEYGMLPRSTESRIDREAVRGKQSGRTQEIQRLIGRSLRAVVDLKALGERQVKIDCDVLQADGGTRTASICGGFLALSQAIQKLLKNKLLSSKVIREAVAGVSCGLVQGNMLLDLEYLEDSQAEVDANFVLTKSGRLIEIQSTAEKIPFTREAFDRMLTLAEAGARTIFSLQEQALSALPE